MVERLNTIPIVIEGLNRVCASLALLFDTKFGELAVASNTVAPNVYRHFFIVVSQLFFDIGESLIDERL
jgi:hypothetical protein